MTVLTPEGWMVIYNFCPADIHWPHQNTPRVTTSMVKQVPGNLTGPGLWAPHQRLGEVRREAVKHRELTLVWFAKVEWRRGRKSPCFQNM